MKVLCCFQALIHYTSKCSIPGKSDVCDKKVRIWSRLFGVQRKCVLCQFSLAVNFHKCFFQDFRQVRMASGFSGRGLSLTCPAGPRPTAAPPAGPGPTRRLAEPRTQKKDRERKNRDRHFFGRRVSVLLSGRWFCFHSVWRIENWQPLHCVGNTKILSFYLLVQSSFFEVT